MMVGPYYMSFIPLLVLSLSLLIRLCVLLQLNKPALVNQKRRTPPLPQIQEQAVGTETKGRIWCSVTQLQLGNQVTQVTGFIYNRMHVRYWAGH